VDIELLLSKRLHTGELDLDAQYLGPVDEISERRAVLNESVAIPAGSSYVIDAGPDPESNERRIAVVLGATVR
jgi:hypothetical protein